MNHIETLKELRDDWQARHAFGKGEFSALTAAISALEEKADIENAIQGACDDNPNEKHCSCVPLLRLKVKQETALAKFAALEKGEQL